MQGMDTVLHSLVVDTVGERFYIDAEFTMWRVPFSQIGSQKPVLEYLDMPQQDINQGMAIDFQEERIFLGQYYSGLFTKKLNESAWTQIVSQQNISPLLGQRGELKIDPKNKQIYFRTAFDGNCDNCRWIYRVDYDGRNLTKIVRANGGDALALDLPNNTLYYTDLPGNCTLKRVNLDGSNIRTLPDIPNKNSYHCWRLEVDHDANKLYMLMGDGAYAGKMTIARMNLDGSTFEILFETKNSPPDGALAILPITFEEAASGNPLPQSTTVTQTPKATSTAAPPPTSQVCGAGWSRLGVGQKAVLLPGLPNLLRVEPKMGDNVIGKLYAGTVVKILEGPVCADGLIFWKVESDTMPPSTGWTAEGNGKEYWLEPYKASTP